MACAVATGSIACFQSSGRAAVTPAIGSVDGECCERIAWRVSCRPCPRLLENRLRFSTNCQSRAFADGSWLCPSRSRPELCGAGPPRSGALLGGHFFNWGKRCGGKHSRRRARRYRDLATELRSSAEAMTHQGARQGMLEAANVWDRLADFADSQVSLFVEAIPHQRRPQP